MRLRDPASDVWPARVEPRSCPADLEELVLVRVVLLPGRRCVFQPVFLRPRSERFKEPEIVVPLGSAPTNPVSVVTGAQA